MSTYKPKELQSKLCNDCRAAVKPNIIFPYHTDDGLLFLCTLCLDVRLEQDNIVNDKGGEVSENKEDKKIV